MNPPISVIKIEKFLIALRKDDIVSSSLFSRKCSLSSELAKRILIDLVDMNILDYFIIVPCSNPIENTEHYMTFHSLEAVNEYLSKQEICPVCNNSDAQVDQSRMKIGFKRHEM